jgi:hypothetical protein
MRSLDFRAELVEYDLDKPLRPLLQLFIECKKGVDQWVFFTDKTPFPYFYSSGFREGRLKVSGKLEYLKSGMGLHKVTNKHLLLETKLSYNYTARIHKDSDFFFTALMQVLKCVDNCESVTRSDYYLLYPLIVYDGNILECTYEEDELNLNEIEFISYLSNGIAENPLPTIVDVVKVDFFTHISRCVKERVCFV